MSDKFPMPMYSDGIKKSTQTRFMGLNHNPAAGDGQIYAMKNLCSDYYPALATRAKRMRIAAPEAWADPDDPYDPYSYDEHRPPLDHIVRGVPNGMFTGSGMLWIDRFAYDYEGLLYNGQVKAAGTPSATKRSFVEFNGEIIILPDMAAYNIEDGSLTNLSVYIPIIPSGGDPEDYGFTFEDGTLYGEPAVGNTIYCPVSPDEFRAGDAVTISGSTIPENNGTFIIREISGPYLRFYENSFTTSNVVQYLTITREVPTLLFAFEHENRLWGCNGNTIYASKLGDARNWYVYDGLETDSWTVDTNDSAKFTGGCTYGGYPLFFKERKLCKVYGSVPSNFEMMETDTTGIAEGSEKSPAIAGGMLFYLSDNGICAYTGGEPVVIGSAFGRERYKNAVGGSDGVKYYVSMQDTAEDWHLFVYDTQRGLWHEEDDKQAINFGYLLGRGNLFFLDSVGDIWATGNYTDLETDLAELLENYDPYEDEVSHPAELVEEDDFDWYAEFTDFTDDSPNKKDIRKLQIRLDLEEDAECTVKLQLDSSGEWITPEGGIIEEEGKRSYYLAIIPQRADHYRLRIEGHGGCIIYSITREYSIGSELKSLPGRQ